MNGVFVDYIEKNLNYHINNISIKQDDILLECSTVNLYKVVSFFKYDENCLFSYLTDIFAIDYPSEQKRFKVVYNLLSVKYNKRIMIYLTVSEVEAIQSVTSLYKNANWLEREVWDMHGIYFKNHSDLRRILTDYGFEGFPLRKDFPLSGYFEVRYDESQKRVLSENIELAQEFRNFQFNTPWD